MLPRPNPNHERRRTSSHTTSLDYYYDCYWWWWIFVYRFYFQSSPILFRKSICKQHACRLTMRLCRLNWSGKIDLFAWVLFFLFLLFFIISFIHKNIPTYRWRVRLIPATECWRWETLTTQYLFRWSGGTMCFFYTTQRLHGSCALILYFFFFFVLLFRFISHWWLSLIMHLQKKCADFCCNKKKKEDLFEWKWSKEHTSHFQLYHRSMNKTWMKKWPTQTRTTFAKFLCNFESLQHYNDIRLRSPS